MLSLPDARLCRWVASDTATHSRGGCKYVPVRTVKPPAVQPGRVTQYGLKVHRPGASYEASRDLALAVEAAGFDGVWALDHLQPMGGEPTTELFATLAALAAETASVRVGSLVASAGYRHPGVLAQAVATIDRVSGGRVDLGIGAGSAHAGADDYRAFGMGFPEYGDRMDALSETCRLLAALWTGDPVDFDGDHFRVAGATVGVTPVQEPHPPIVVGGSTNRAVGVAGRHARGVNLSTGADGGLDDLVTAFRDLDRRATGFCERIGRGPDTLDRSVQVFLHAGPRDAVVAAVGELVDAGADEVMFVPSPPFADDLAASLADDLGL